MGNLKKGEGVIDLSNSIKGHKAKCLCQQDKEPKIRGKGDIKYCEQSLVDIRTIKDDTVQVVLP